MTPSFLTHSIVTLVGMCSEADSGQHLEQQQQQRAVIGFKRHQQLQQLQRQQRQQQQRR